MGVNWRIGGNSFTTLLFRTPVVFHFGVELFLRLPWSTIPCQILSTTSTTPTSSLAASLAATLLSSGSWPATVSATISTAWKRTARASSAIWNISINTVWWWAAYIAVSNWRLGKVAKTTTGGCDTIGKGSTWSDSRVEWVPGTTVRNCCQADRLAY